MQTEVKNIINKTLRYLIVSCCINNNNASEERILHEVSEILSDEYYPTFFKSLANEFKVDLDSVYDYINNLDCAAYIEYGKKEIFVNNSKIIKYDKHELASPLWRMQNLYSVLTSDAKIKPFSLKYAQKIVMRNIHNRMLILKARQLGITTQLTLLALDSVLFNDNYKAVIILQTLGAAKEIKRVKIDLPFLLLPDKIRDYFKNKLTKHNTESLVFSNNSNISVQTTVRSSTVNFLLISEYASMCSRFPIKAEEVITGGLPAVHKDSIVIFESTADGSNDFRTRYELSSTKPESYSDYKKLFLAWWLDNSYVLEKKPEVSSDIEKYSKDYFNHLEKNDVFLSEQQKNFWLLKYKEIGEKVYSEYPTTEEEAFKTSVRGAYFKDEMLSMMREKRFKICFDANKKVYTGWDLGIHDYTVCLFFHYENNIFYFFEEYYKNNTSHMDCINDVLNKKHKLDLNFYPHDSLHREKSHGLSLKQQIYRKYQNYNIHVVPRTKEKYNSITTVRNHLHNCIIDPRCIKLKDALENYKAIQVKSGNDENLGSKPEHSVHSHFYDAFECAILGTLSILINTEWQQNFLRR